MGKWTVESISASGDALDDGEKFGTNFRVKLRLAYAPSIGQRMVGKLGARSDFRESPVLDWHEKFTTLWHHAGSYWTFETNMFRHKPGSATFDAWSKRYIAAYAFATGTPYLLRKGTVEFYDKKGRALSPDEFAGKPAGSNEEKAEVIREYLARHGGVLVIEIHDVPSIGTSSPKKHVERLLLFDCGLEGDDHRVQAMQYLNVDTSRPRGTWQREFEMSAPFTRNDQPTHGLRRVQTPADVGTPNQILVSGESL